MPIQATAISHSGYRKVMEEIIPEYSIDFLIISSFIGHSLDLLEVERPSTIVFHDYYPFCPAIYINYNGVCTSCNKQLLRTCAQNNTLNKFFKNVPTEKWLALRTHYIRGIMGKDIKLVVPTPSVRQNLIKLIPDFIVKEFACIPHGVNKIARIVNEPKFQHRSRLRIVILGHLTEQKGLRLFNEIYKEVHRFADLYLVGCGEDGLQYRGQYGITIIESYTPEQLWDLLDEISPDLGLLLSVWPETFSYTLSELLLSSIPVLATNLGSFSDRIIEGKTGFLIDPEPAAIIRKLKDIIQNQKSLQRARKYIADYRHIRLEEMVKEYHASQSGLGIPASICKPQSAMAITHFKYYITSVSDSIETNLDWMHDNIRGKIAAANGIKPWIKTIGIIFVNAWMLFAKLLLRIVRQ